MKNNKNYALLERRIFIKFCIILLVLAIALFGFAEFLRGTFGNTIVSLLQDFFDLSNQDALVFYNQIIRENVYTIMILILLIIIIVMFRMLLSSITKYFDEINTAADALLAPEEKEISLSPELSFMEIKLQMCKEMIEKREQEAKTAEQRKNDLVVYLAHDIKTPLTSVIGYLELLKEMPDMPVEQRAKYTKITLEKANRLEHLINEFFEITRFNLNTIVLNKQNVNITFMLQQLADEFYPMLQTKRNTISLDVPEGIFIHGDSDKLSRVFNNIIKNAVSYSYTNSNIHIQLEKTEKEIIVSITNSGDTIAEHQIEVIFEKFYRLDSARSSTTGGSGLGLSIAKEIVTAHGGTIHVISKNNSTSFIVHLTI